MSGAMPLFVAAGEREAGVICSHCAEPVEQGNQIAVCQRCGTVHHRSCWEKQDHCGAYACAPGRVDVEGNAAQAWRITPDDINRVSPLPSRRSVPGGTATLSVPVSLPRTNRLALAAFVVALAGIPLFGVLTGLVAILLGSLALGNLRTASQRGTGF